MFASILTRVHGSAICVLKRTPLPPHRTPLARCCQNLTQHVHQTFRRGTLITARRAGAQVPRYLHGVAACAPHLLLL